VDCEYIPDLSAKYPLFVSGRFKGELPETLYAKGYLSDMNEISIELKVQHIKDIPLDKVRFSHLLVFLLKGILLLLKR
jgi:hypothetical protein